MQAEFKAWLDQALSELEVDADVYGEYIGGIMADDNMPLPDRCAASVDVLATVTERNVAFMQKALEQQWQRAQKVELDAKRRDTELAAAQREAELAKEREFLEAERERRLAEARATLSKDERRQRNKLVEEFGFEVLTTVDADGNIVEITKEAKPAEATLGVERNLNKAIVAEQERLRRAEAKVAHEEKVRRDKEQQERERLKKEKEKRRTMKKEKRRGAG